MRAIHIDLCYFVPFGVTSLYIESLWSRIYSTFMIASLGDEQGLRSCSPQSYFVLHIEDFYCLLLPYTINLNCFSDILIALTHNYTGTGSSRIDEFQKFVFYISSFRDL